MSRIGVRPIEIPEGVEISVDAGVLRIKGARGELSLTLPEPITAKVEDGRVLVNRKRNTKLAKSLHGTIARKIRNMVKGVTDGWSKTLELVGTGYRARLEGNTLVLSIGYSHPVRIEPPEGVNFSVEENKVTVSGIDKNLVGQVAANIKSTRPPEPYKGKGVKSENEVIRRKAGKATKVGPAA